MLKNKILFWALIVLVILVSGLIVFNEREDQQIKIVEGKYYQGPVPDGYDEKYFRQTGITTKEVSNAKPR